MLVFSGTQIGPSLYRVIIQLNRIKSRLHQTNIRTNRKLVIVRLVKELIRTHITYLNYSLNQLNLSRTNLDIKHSNACVKIQTLNWGT